MHKLFSIAVLLTLAGVIFYSCKKYKDPPPGSDPRLTHPYCNDPAAVNYNVGFPGKPDISLCFYPSDLFVGTYLCRDTVVVGTSGLFISADSFYINIFRTSTTDKSKIGVSGFCGAGFNLLLTADISYSANVDTTMTDTLLVHRGQTFCHPYDTITGTLTRDRIDSTLVLISFTVYSDTATYIYSGRAIKQ